MNRIINQIKLDTLKFEEVGSLLVDVGPFGFEHGIETLALQRTARHREIDERHPRTNVRRELDRRIASRQDDRERR